MVHNIFCFRVYLFSVIFIFSINLLPAQKVDSMTYAKYAVLSKNYSAALDIYHNNREKLKNRDKYLEFLCYLSLGQFEKACELIKTYNISNVYLKNVLSKDDLNSFKSCQIAESAQLFSEIDMKVNHLYEIDQYIRISSIVDSTMFRYFEYQYIPYHLKKVLKSLESYPNLNPGTENMLEVVLLHQVREPKFYPENDKLFYTLLKLDVFSPVLYALFVDNYYLYNYDYQIFGTWGLTDVDKCAIKVQDPANLDKKRGEIGLPPFSYEPIFFEGKVKLPDWYLMK